jgi:hypothetical protein
MPKRSMSVSLPESRGDAFAANQDKIYSHQRRAHAAFKRFISVILLIAAVLAGFALWILAKAGALPFGFVRFSILAP